MGLKEPIKCCIQMLCFSLQRNSWARLPSGTSLLKSTNGVTPEMNLPCYVFLNRLGVIWKAVNKPFKFFKAKRNKSPRGRERKEREKEGERKKIYSAFPELQVSRCSPFDLATGNDFLKWFLMVPDIIYGTPEQSCNVLNYTKLSELVAS